MAKRKSSSFLPKFLQTTKNEKFLHATLDQLLNSKNLERIDGFVGKRRGPSYSIDDPYISTVGVNRQNYQLEPSTVYKKNNEIEFVVTYDDLINNISANGGNSTRHDRLFEQEYYNWGGFSDYDKLINFGEYYWLPSGPGTVAVSANDVPVNANFTVTQSGLTDYKLSPTYGETTNPTIYLVRGGSYNFVVDQTSQFWIQSEPGTTGKSLISFNRSTRDIFGVTNNGQNNGTVTFNVPKSRDQQFFTQTLVNIAAIDLASDLTHKQINGKTVTQVKALGGVDGQLFLENKTVIFTHSTEDDSNWDATTVLPKASRFSIFRIQVGGSGKITLLPIQAIDVDKKVQINEGQLHSTKEYYRNPSVDSLQVVPTITAPVSTLYYQDSTEDTRYGVIKLIDPDYRHLDIDNEITGKKAYTSPNGVEFTNGLHVSFDTTVLPNTYQSNTYIVDGVGDGIFLINKDEHISYELASTETKDYITVRRGSVDRNAWSRSNHWYHKAVVNTIATHNKTIPTLDQTARANRPIIEFNKNLNLFNHGEIGLVPIDLYDSTTTDALSVIQNSGTFRIDGVQLTDGMRVVFSADTNLEVKNKIYIVNIVNFQNSGSTEVRLVESTTDTIAVGTGFAVKQGTLLKGNSYKWTGTAWQLCQAKTLVNQAPLFDIFDATGTSFSDTTSYIGNNFTGSKIFSYAIGTGAADKELGFALKYRNFSNIGDITFNNDYSTDTFSYTTSTGSATKNVNTGFIRSTDVTLVKRYTDGWVRVINPSTQYQEIMYFASGDAKQFDLGVAPVAATASRPSVIIYKDNVEITTGWSATTFGSRNVIEFTTAPAAKSQIIIEVLSNTATLFGTYQVPVNFSNNAFNAKFDTITLGQMRNHVDSTLKTATDFKGSYPGSSNLRDIVNSSEHAGNILHHSAGMVFPSVFLQDSNLNFVKSVEYNASEYSKFKQKFIQAANTLDLDFSDIPGAVDVILASINNTKSSTFPFYNSDMAGHGTNKKIRKYTITDDRQLSYQFDNTYALGTNSSRSVLVYRNNIQLQNGTDYTFSSIRAAVNVKKGLLALNDVIKIVDYTSTFGNYIPPTPSKLGLYPKFQPVKYTDNSYFTAVEMIQGHDGSKTRAFGGYLDSIILELENRIYNNIKATYKPEVLDIQDVMPGRWRDTSYTLIEKNDIIAKFFLKWAIQNRVDWTTNAEFTSDNQYSWNYNQLNDKLTDELLPGFWRGIYNFYYDTDRPDTHPWEMLGIYEKPSWWETRYGPAPYASGNLVLWEDLRDGKVYSDGEGITFTTNTNYARPDLLDMIPVDTHGSLRTPWQTLAKGSTTFDQDNNWTLNDFGPAQSAWMKSSDWPFICQIAMGLMKPAKYFALVYDTDIISRSTLTNNIVNISTNKQIQRTDIKIPFVDSDIINGYATFIGNYMQFLGVATTTLEDIVDKMDINLACKLSSYTDKKFLKVLAEQVSPNAVSENVIIPDEDYSLHVQKTGPIIKAPYSGVIVQRSDTGWLLYGYDHTNPFFTVIPSVQSGNVTTHEVLGDRYYEYKDSEDFTLQIAYGTELKSPQQVFDFLIGYGRYLSLIGYDFDNSTEQVADGVITANWAMSGKEFAYWNKQNWGVGAVISISPSANFLQFNREDGMIDSLVSDIGSSKSVLNQNFDSLTIDSYKTKREDGRFELVPAPDAGGIYYADLKVVQYEHVLVLNNTTVFNDIVYQPELGNRQNRLRLVGWRTQGWDGSLTAQGFILNRGKVDSFIQNTDYSKGAIVKYNDKLYTSIKKHTSGSAFDYNQWAPTDSFKLGLLPNWDTLGGNFESFYDLDEANLEGDADRFGKSVIGYQSRTYLQNLGLNDTSQIKFYQGMIREKGTKNSIDKLLRAKLDNTTSDIELYEEWAIRSGEFGGTDVNNRIEIQLKETETKGNPSVIRTIPSIEQREEGVYNLLASKFYEAPPTITDKWIPLSEDYGIISDALPYAGYAKLTDADATLFNITSYQNLDTNIASMDTGYVLYVANDLTFDWNMYYLDVTTMVVTTAQASQNKTILWTTENHHTLNVDDFIVVKGFGAGSGVHRVLRTTGLKTFETDEDVEGLDVAGEAVVLRFNSIRFATEDKLTTFNPQRGWKLNDKVFIDNYDSKWTVFEKTKEYANNYTFTPNIYSYTDGQFGHSIAVNGDESLAAFGMPTVSTLGKVATYTPNIEGKLSESKIITPTNSTVREFGHSVDVYEETVAIGAPGTNASQGAIFVYKLNKATYEWECTFAWSVSGASKLGSAVKFSKDGSTLFAGSPGNDSVYVFDLVQAGGTTEINIVEDTITTDGTTTFTTNVPMFAGRNVTLEDVTQIEGVDYTLTDSLITFSVAPAASKTIRINTGLNILQTKVIASGGTDDFGASIDTNTTGDKVVIGAPKDDGAGTDRGAVYVYTKAGVTFKRADNATLKADDSATTTDSGRNGWTQQQKITATLTNNFALYGHDVAMTADGLKVFAGSPGLDRFESESGMVTVHAYASGTWSLVHNITVDAQLDGQNFGRSIAVNPDGSVLSVGAPTSVFDSATTFDDSVLTVDSKATAFVDRRVGGGNVYVYQSIGSSYIQTQKLANASVQDNDRFGSDLAIIGTTIFVGTPFDDSKNTNAGRVFEYRLDGSVFTTSETETQLVNPKRINRVFSYNKITNKIINYYDWIDPIKGKIPGLADENIDYKTLWDPAVYAAEGASTWSKNQVGKIWWDLSTVKYNYAEQGDWAYRSTFWGTVFPGSTIDVYSWVESSVAPSAYAGEGVPYNVTTFVTNTIFNNQSATTKYYFWVRGIRDVTKNHTTSPYNVAQIIVDPTTYGIKYVAFTSASDIVSYNLNGDITGNDTILAVDFDVKKNDQILHTEWSIIKEGYAEQALPTNIQRKLIDSLVGADTRGNQVPDSNLNITQQHGVQFRPRQSMFVNRFTALKTFVDLVNPVLLANPIAISRDISALLEEDKEPTLNSGEWNQRVENQEQLGFVRSESRPVGWRVLVATDSNVQNLWSIYSKLADGTWTLAKLQSYDVKTQWAYADWYATGYTSKTYVSHLVDLKKDLVNLTTIVSGDVVKVDNGGAWELLYYNGEEYTTVGIANGTLQLGTSLYDYTNNRYGFDSEVFDFQLFDQEPQTETRKIIGAILDSIFVEDLKIQYNNLIMAMIYHILDEQPYVDWLFKTSFVSVNHNIRALDALPYYRRDNQTYVNDFIAEAKPYHTKVREYVLNYNNTEPWGGDVTDFDVASYYDTTLGYYRKPNTNSTEDVNRLKAGANSQYNSNKTSIVKELIIEKAGTSYTVPPVITISGGGGTGATATAVIAVGVVTSIIVTNQGTGYTSTPTVTFSSSSGITASAYARLSNAQIRTFESTLKFDRIKYTSNIKEWKANTAFTSGDRITHKGEAYTANENFTSGLTFTSDSLTVIADETFTNAMDRAIAYYQPTSKQPAKQLENLFYGIEYPRNKITGPTFDKEPGYARGGFDSIPFDNFEIGPEGLNMISGVSDTNITASNIAITGAEMEAGAFVAFDFVDPGYTENQTVLVEGLTVSQVLANRFGDSLLGTRPEDIDIVGGKFVDQHSSHAPEEFIPGRVFDSLDMEIYQTPSTLEGGSSLSPKIDVVKHKADGTTKRFSFMPLDNTHGDNIMLYTAQQGKVQPDEFTLDYTTFEVVFAIAPTAGDIIDIINIGTTGQNLVLDVVYVGNGTDKTIILPVKEELAKQSLVLVNGVKTAHTISDVNERGVLTFSTAPATGTHIHVFVFNLDPSIEIAYSHVAQDVLTMDGSTKVFTLTNQPFYDGPTDAKLFVELNENRLRPAVYTYFTGDGSTQAFALTINADVNHRTLVAGDISIYINGAANTNWTLGADDGSSARQVTFASAPTSGSKIAIGDNRNAEYTVVSNTLTLASGVAVASGTKLNLTTFSNHDTLEITAQTFKGLTASEVTITIGYDGDNYDASTFDSDSIAVINSPLFDLYRTITDINYIWVTLNGIKLSVGTDYEVNSSGDLLIKMSISSSDIIVVNQFSDKIIKKQIAWRMWRDVVGTTRFTRMISDATTKIAVALNRSDTTITVVNGTKLADPDLAGNIPGVVFIGNERITYWKKDGNVLSNLRRGTMGTAISFRHYKGDLVIDSSLRQEIPNPHTNVWYNISSTTDSLQYHTTQQAKFLNEFAGTTPIINIAYDQNGKFIKSGYVNEDYVQINE